MRIANGQTERRNRNRRKLELPFQQVGHRGEVELRRAGQTIGATFFEFSVNSDPEKHFRVHQSADWSSKNFTWKKKSNWSRKSKFLTSRTSTIPKNCIISWGWQKNWSFPGKTHSKFGNVTKYVAKMRKMFSNRTDLLNVVFKTSVLLRSNLSCKA